MMRKDGNNARMHVYIFVYLFIIFCLVVCFLTVLIRFREMVRDKKHFMQKR